jgi:predicted DNA binding CopG/RHH family protein
MNGDDYMNKNKFQYAGKDTLPEKIEDKDVTVQIALKIEGDLLKEIRARAAEAGLPYQTFMKQALRRWLAHGELNTLDARIKKLERDFESIDKMINSMRKQRRRA